MRHVGEPLQLLGGRAEVEDVAGAVNVHSLGDLERHGEVVDRGEVVDAAELAAKALVGLVVEAQARLGDVAGDELDPFGVDGRRGLAGGVEHAGLDQGDEAKVALAREQAGRQAPADEAREAGEEIDGHQRAGPAARGRSKSPQRLKSRSRCRG